MGNLVCQLNFRPRILLLRLIINRIPSDPNKEGTLSYVNKTLLVLVPPQATLPLINATQDYLFTRVVKSARLV